MKHFATTVQSADELSSKSTVRVFHKQRLELIQTCRGIAALFVLLFHVTELSHEKANQTFMFGLFQSGDSGVNFFFVLSGFIVYWVHRFDIGRIDRLKPFVLKRFIRIYPFYWIITLALIPVYFLTSGLGQGYEHDSNVIIKSLLLLPQNHPPILTVGWSLSYEILFYLIFCLMILLRPKISSRIVAVWLLGTLLVQVLRFNPGLEIESNLFLQFVFSTHNFEFALGCLSAYVVAHNNVQLREGFIFLAMGSFLFVSYGLSQTAQSTLDRVLACGVPSMLIVVGAASLDLGQSLKLPRIFPFLGDASYSVYLIHYPCLSVIFKIALMLNLFNGFGYLISTGLIVMITLAIGCLTYIWIEKPLLSFFRKNLLPSPC